jgi:hypothetical protein
MKTEEQIEKAVENFNKTIQMAAWKSTLKEKMKTKYSEFPDEIKDKIVQEKKISKKMAI